MTASRDADRLVRAFLLEGDEELSDRVYDAVRAEIEQTRQRTVFGPWRTPSMNKYMTLGLGAAAVVLALLVGVQLLGSPSGNVGGPGGETTPTSEPTATPEPRATEWTRGLPEGSHLMWEEPATGASITVTIPAREWDGTPRQGYIQWGPTGADGPAGAGVIGFTEGEYFVYGDPCAWFSTRPDTPATTVDALVAALANQAFREASAPEDITVDGYAGKKIILHMADEVSDFDACDKDGRVEEGDPTFGLFAVPHESPARYSQDVGQIEEVWAVDVDGQLVVNIGVYYPDTPQNAIDQVRAILASATFDLP
jgi:hypothetical protein